MEINAAQGIDRLRLRRDAELGRALIRAQRVLQAETLAAYLLDDEGSLSVAAILDTPLGFTVNPSVESGDERYVSAAAFQRRRALLVGSAEVRRIARATPANVKHIPFDMKVASAPVSAARAAHQRYGVLTARWVPDRDVSGSTMASFAEVARDLGRALESLAEAGTDLSAPRTPVFVSTPQHGSVTQQAVEGEADPRPPRLNYGSRTYLFRLQKLGGRLASAARVADVIAAVQAEVVRPLGGRGIVVCLVEQGHLQVVGSAGATRDDVRNVDGLENDAHAPETEAVKLVSPRLYASVRALHEDYPGLDRYHDDKLRAFLPLVSNGRVAGCCVISSDRPLALSNEQLALLMIMLSQVAQSLDRTRAHEIERATVQGMRRALLPRGLPHVRELDMVARYAPHPQATGRLLGSEWYDVLELPDRQIGMIIGWVRGRELDAIGVMGQLRAGVRAYAMEEHDPAGILTRSNRLLAALDTDLLAGCCCLWLDLRNGVMTVANADHPAALVTGRDQTAHPEHLPVGPPLGQQCGTVYRQDEVVVAPGGLILLHTGAAAAGMSESTVERLRADLADHAADNLEPLADLIDDDTTLLLARYEGPRSKLGRTAHASVERHEVERIHELRAFLRGLSHAWGLDAITANLELLASEVVTNALIHAHTDVDVLLREYPDRLRVEVRDNDPRPPVPAAVIDLDEADLGQAESGRGLIIVEAVADAWGSSPAGRGKSTWFELVTPEA